MLIDLPFKKPHYRRDTKTREKSQFLLTTFSQEIEFISTVIGELIKKQEDQLMNLQIDTRLF